MYSSLVFAHSWTRWIVLVLIVVVIVQSFLGWFNQQKFTSSHRKTSLMLLIFSHLQLVMGLLLYFVYSPNVQQAFKNFKFAMKDKMLRFWAIEHISMMLIAIVLIQIGYSRAKRAKQDNAKHKSLAIFTTIAVVVILLGVNWTPLFRF
ncbi:MAG: cytochrome B [Bacteroidetes bacterium]|nr:MAG: cytochrome B [Bacteroidota bacterium]TAG88543.1 MAG: cytochrome B [Bacteroidota bacterium]